ncbi:MAG TPA: sulfurtransferase [Chloroflexota bacterium]|nr:sulfurtransferase [Chloroflexota bacterium]
MTDYTHPELLVSTEWLAEHLSDANLRIVDCRNYFDGRSGRQAYLDGHLPKAVHVDYPTDLGDPDAKPPNLIPGPEYLAATMRRLGIGNDTTVVGYDDEGGHFVSRLWLNLTYYGHNSVKVLNGGIQKWVAESRPLVAGPVDVPPGNFVPGPPHPELNIGAAELRDRLRDPNLVILDVRRPTEFSGEEVRAARGGRIPGARLQFWRDNLNPDWTFKTADEIREWHRAIGVEPDQPVVTYCQGGVRAAHAALSLRLVGHDNVRVYDGSWAEWGNRDDLPVEVG